MKKKRLLLFTPGIMNFREIRAPSGEGVGGWDPMVNRPQTDLINDTSN